MSNFQKFPAANPIPDANGLFTGAPFPQTADDDVPVIEKIWLAANKYRIDIVVIIVLALLTALLATVMSTPKYTATSRIEISRQQERVTNVESLQPETSGEDLEFYQSQYALLQAHSLAERVVRSEHLATDTAFLTAYGLNEDSNSAGPVPDLRAREKLIADILIRNVQIAPVRNSSLVDVSFTSPDPALSQRIANAWVNQFIEQTLARRYDSTAEARSFLTTRLADLRQKLEESERNLVRYSEQKNILPLETTVDAEGRTTGVKTLAATDLEALTSAMAQATNDRIAAQSRLVGAGVMADGGTDGNAVLSGLRQKRAEVAAEYAKLGAQFEAGYPPVQSLKSQLAALDSAIAKEEARSVAATRQAYKQALQRENDLRARIHALENNLYAQRSNSIQYNIYQRDVDTNRALYDGLLQRYKEIGVAGVGSSNIAVVDAASRPEGPSSPNLKLNLALAFIFGIGLAAAYAFIREQIDQSIADPADVSTLLGLSLLGPVPKDEDVSSALKDRKSEIAEAYSSIATSLSFLTDHGVPRSMMFTSTVANEGKSTSAYALAETISRLGKKVIVVDADLRNPSIHTFYGIPNEHGLSNCLSGGAAIEDLVAHPADSKVEVLPAGPPPPSSVELLSSDRMNQIVRQLGTMYDHVLLDGPPVLGLADAPLLSRVVEGVVLAIESNHVRARRIKDAVKRIEAAHSHIFGVILTKIHKRNAAYGYGYGYGRQFEYG